MPELSGRLRSYLVMALVLAATTLFASLAPAALAQETGTIVGHVGNGTAGAAPPADLDVVVHILQNRVKTGEQRVRTDANGNFTVTGLATGTDLLYFPIAEYGGVSYYPNQPVTLSTAEPVATEITVFEATPRPDAISFDRLNMLVIGVTPTALTVMQMGAAVNSGDRVFAADPQVTGSARTLRFSLPQGAIDVTPQAGLPGDTLETTPDGFATTDPVRPGRREIAFSYEIPYSASSLDLEQSFAFPVGTFTLFVPPEVGDVVGPGMVLQGTAELGGRQFRQYVVENVEPGAEVRFRLTGLPAPLFARPRDLGLLVAGVAGVILVAFLALAVRRRAATGPEPVEEPTPAREPMAAATSAERAELVRSVAELDARFADGGLEEAAYRAERAERKARLVELTRAASAP